MLSLKEGYQGPITPGVARNADSRLRIASHPAVRLGFLDAQHGRPFDHDDIMGRIQRETPPSALKRLGYDCDLFSPQDVERAQYRYEEGRLLVVKYGLRCRSWNHPDYLPRAVEEFVLHRPDNEPL